MYPDFVKELSTNEDGSRVLSICEKIYVAQDNDYIDDAIELASRWWEYQISYERIIHLRNWMQKNHELEHPIPYKHLNTMKECMQWVESVIHTIARDYLQEDGSSRRGTARDWEDEYYKDLEDNIIIFAKISNPRRDDDWRA